MIHVGVVGYGYWGPNLVRNFADSSEFQVAAVSDLRAERLSLAERRHPGIRTTMNCSELIADPRIDAIVIATPVSQHYELAWRALRAGKHVLVEKPLTSNREHALRLIEEADKRHLVLMVDHTFVFTGAVRKISELLADGQLGQIYYYDSVRVNLGLFQSDVNVLWDLAVHDLAILDYLLPERPCAVSASGTRHVAGGPESIAYVTLFFPTGFIAHIHVNWLAPVKVRRTLIGGNKKMIVYDDVEPSEKIKVYDKGITLTANPDQVYQMLIAYRTGDMWAPHIDITEALKIEVAEFARCIEHSAKPITDGACGLRIVRLLEAASESVKERGRPVELSEEAVEL